MPRSSMPPSTFTYPQPKEHAPSVLREDGIEADIGKEHADTFILSA